LVEISKVVKIAGIGFSPQQGSSGSTRVRPYNNICVIFLGSL
jgi:hypothetical protein